jgi:hypothetical protein
MSCLGPRKKSAAQIEQDGAYIHGERIWSYSVTLTFRYQTGEEKAFHVLREWLRAIARYVVRSHVTFAYAMDEQERGAVHFHLLLAFDPIAQVFRPDLARAMWRLATNGAHADIKRYHLEEKAAFYLAKHAKWGIEVVCSRSPKCRRSRKRCELSSSAW